jgi:hypothetical protein
MYQKIISDNEMSWEDTKTESARVEEMKRRQTEAHLHTVRQHVQRAEHLEYELQQVFLRIKLRHKIIYNLNTTRHMLKSSKRAQRKASIASN